MTTRRAAAWLLLAIGLVYSLAHFALSGVRRPLDVPNLGQVIEEYEVLRVHLATGRPIHIQQPRQYGPAYILVMHGVVNVCGSDSRCLLRSLYTMQMMALGGAFVFCWLSLRLWLERIGRMPRDAPSNAVLVLALVILWANFAPLLGIVATKNVETWELCLLAAALYASLREWRLLAGACVAIAALTKLLPFALFFYFLLADRRALVYACASALAIIAVAHALYGPEMGLGYAFNIVFGAAAPSAYGNVPSLAWHENISLKGIVAKLFGHLDAPRLAPSLGYPQVGYVTVATPRMRLAGNIVSYAVQGAALCWMVAVFLRSSSLRWRAETRTIWDWSFITLMMLVLAPQTGIDYQTLALIAFSFVLVAALALPELRRDRLLLVTYAGAIVLVANIVPRSVIVRLSGVSRVLAWNHYTHLTPLEGFSYYGYPLLGLILMAVALMRVRRLLGTGSVAAVAR